jgi:hypothetical protein
VYFLGRVFEGIGEYCLNTKSPPIPTSLGDENTREVNKALTISSTLGTTKFNFF